MREYKICPRCKTELRLSNIRDLVTKALIYFCPQCDYKEKLSLKDFIRIKRG